MSPEIIGAPKPVCPTCGTKNTNGYEGVDYGNEISFEAMECDDCGTTFDCLWTRAGVDNVQLKGERDAERKANAALAAAKPGPSKHLTFLDDLDNEGAVA